MKVLFLHGWRSAPGGVMPKHLRRHGHEVLDPALDDEDWEGAVRAAQLEFDRHRPDVVVGSSRGAAVAMNIRTGSAPLILLCPAWKRCGTATTVGPGTVILHSDADDVVPLADSRELVRASGLPDSALIVVGDDHRLADPKPFAAMLEEVSLSVPTLCLGIDVTWWGGSPRRRESQRDTIVHALVGGRACSDVDIDMVDLSAAPNPEAGWATEPNFEADGRRLVDRINRILDERAGEFQRCVVALDAPLEARPRPGQPPRMKAVAMGTSTGSKRRECEDHIQEFKRGRRVPEHLAWNAGLHIQSGSPIPARLDRVLRTLEQESGFSVSGSGSRATLRDVIEIFPPRRSGGWASAAIIPIGARRRYAPTRREAACRWPARWTRPWPP